MSLYELLPNCLGKDNMSKFETPLGIEHVKKIRMFRKLGKTIICFLS